MDKSIKWKMESDANIIVKILNDKHYNAHYCKDIETARNMILEMIPHHSSIALGGSVTLNELDIINEFKSENYKLFDRYKPNIPFTETVEIMRQSMLADFLITGTNAITKNGELVNVDSTGNRAAAMIFGPKKVIVVAGVNKITDNIDTAMKRIKSIAPINAKRINHKSPCTTTGECMDCDCKGRICNYTSIVHNGRKFDGRITILIVPENLGY